MDIQKKGDGSVIIGLEGKIDISNYHLLSEQLQAFYEKGYNNITLDFNQLTGIDSTGLGKLLLYQKKFTERGGGIKIINITSKYIRKVFKMLHLYKIIDNEGGSV